MKSKTLGKGLGALFPETESNKERHPGIRFLKLEEIVPNPYQPRKNFSDHGLKELADSMQSNGVIQPLIVRKNGKTFELIAGERRFRAAKLAKIEQVPVVIRQASDRESLEMALIENIQREDLNCIETAFSYLKLKEEFQLTQDEIAKKVGKDRVSVSHYLRLVKLPEEIQEALRESKLSFGHAKAILSVEDPMKKRYLAQLIQEKNLSVREAEEKARGFLEEKSPNTTSRNGSAFKKKEIELTKKIGFRVKIQGTEDSGSVRIQYQSKEDFDNILSLFINTKG